MSEQERRRAARRHSPSPLLVDVGLVAAFVVLPLAVLASDPKALGHGLGAADVVGAILAVPLILLGRRAPLPALAVGVAATVATIAVTGERAVLFAVVVLLLYTMASRTDRRTAWIAGGVTAAVSYVAAVVFLDGSGLGRELGVIAWSLMAVAVGDAVRSRRDYLAAVEERARRAEESREEEARRRVVEERLRIARELHDLVAHRMAVINVQAGVASHLLRSRPDEAEQAMRIVRASASEVLGELGDMLSVLRNVDDPEAPVEPAPTLRDLGTLVESFAAAGLEVSWESSGTLEDVPDSVQLALFRLVQEGLTNAQRYGEGRASVRVERSPAAVDVAIENRIAAGTDPAAGSGYGLLGMRERVAAVGGTVEIGPTGDGRFGITAHLPAARRDTDR